VFWEHPAVRGITLWGYRPGHWRTAQGAYIVLDNGAERPAMVWLQGYVKNAVLKPWVTTSPTAQLTLADVTTADAGAYDLVISNSADVRRPAPRGLDEHRSSGPGGGRHLRREPGGAGERGQPTEP
jgi:hypothetical protein